MRGTALLLTTMTLTVLLACGTALALNSIQCEPDERCNGTAKRDLMKGTRGPDSIDGKTSDDVVRGSRGRDGLRGGAGDDLLVGGKGFDTLVGGSGNDTLKGGKGLDNLIGDNGNDTLKGGKGRRDVYELFAFDSGREVGWGDDTIVDATVPQSDDPYSGNTLNVFRDYDMGALVIDLNSGPGPEATNGTDTVNWSGDVIEDVYNDAPTDDRVVGNDGDNTLVAGDYEGRTFSQPGDRDSDTVLGEGGDDDINVRDRSGDDTVGCGDGDDTVLFDEGDTLLDPDACENVNPQSP